MGFVLHGNAEREVDSGTGWISTFFFGLELMSTCMWPESNRKQKGVHRYARTSHRKSKNPAKRLQRDLRWTFLLIINKIVSWALPQGMTIQLFFARWVISTLFWSQYNYSPTVQNENTHGLVDSTYHHEQNPIQNDGQLEWCTLDHQLLPSWPWALPKANHFVFTPWLHNNLDESYVWWSFVKLIGELGSKSLLNHCQNWVHAQDSPSSEDSSAHIHMHI